MDGRLKVLEGGEEAVEVVEVSKVFHRAGTSADTFQSRPTSAATKTVEFLTTNAKNSPRGMLTERTVVWAPFGTK